jgi:hypothetical protein
MFSRRMRLSRFDGHGWGGNSNLQEHEDGEDKTREEAV